MSRSREGVVTEFGRTWIIARLEKVDLEYDQGKNCFHHLIISMMPLVDTDVVTTIRINTISKKDLKNLAKLFNKLAEELPKEST